MPTYQYRCTECSHDLEAVQKFSDASLTECPSCGGQLRKIFNAVGVVFKGSGFYRNDSRAGGHDGDADKDKDKDKDKSESGAPEKVSSLAESGSKDSAAKPAKTDGGSEAAKPAAKSNSESSASKTPVGSSTGAKTATG